MILIGDIGNTVTKICIVNSNYKIIKRILIPTKKVNKSLLAKELNFKTTEKNRSPGYKQIKNIQKSIITKAKKILEKDDLDWM